MVNNKRAAQQHSSTQHTRSHSKTTENQRQGAAGIYRRKGGGANKSQVRKVSNQHGEKHRSQDQVEEEGV